MSFLAPLPPLGAATVQRALPGDHMALIHRVRAPRHPGASRQYRELVTRLRVIVLGPRRPGSIRPMVAAGYYELGRALELDAPSPGIPLACADALDVVLGELERGVGGQ